MNELFDNKNIISCYTWDDAVRDGTFVEVTGLARNWGFNYPIAITRSVFSLCEAETEYQTSNNIVRLLLNLKEVIQSMNKDVDKLSFKHIFDDKKIMVWTSIEGRSPQNPEPVMTIYLPEEH